MANHALDSEGVLADAYARLSVALDFDSFQAMFAAFEQKRDAICRLRRAAAAASAACRPTSGRSAPTSTSRPAPRTSPTPPWPPTNLPPLARGRRGAVRRRVQTDDKCAQAPRRGQGPRRRPRRSCSPPGARARRSSTGSPRPSRLKPARGPAHGPAQPSRTGWRTRARAAARGQGRRGHRPGPGAGRAPMPTAYRQAKADARRARLRRPDPAQPRELVAERPDAAWVLYKLDGGIDHILVDEAQDTAPEQWDIVRQLAGEFLSGAGAARQRRTDRTLFVVGDEKQSIYCFQGADPQRLLSETQAYYRPDRGRRPRRLERCRCWSPGARRPRCWRFVDALFVAAETRRRRAAAGRRGHRQPARLPRRPCRAASTCGRWSARRRPRTARPGTRRSTRRPETSGQPPPGRAASPPRSSALVARGDAVFDKEAPRLARRRLRRRADPGPPAQGAVRGDPAGAEAPRGAGGRRRPAGPVGSTSSSTT